MPVVSGSHNGRQIIIPTFVTHPRDLTIAQPFTGRGLIDTGATITAISREIAVTLGLEPEGKRVITNTHGQARSNQHRFRLGFLADAIAGDDPERPKQPFFLDDLIFGIDLVAGQSFDILIGMDVLSLTNLRVDRDRRYSLVF